jgi:urease accessory protein UreH
MADDDGFEFNQKKADEAEVLLRKAALEAGEANLSSGAAVSSTHAASHPFGTSPEAESLARKWDTAATARSAEALKVSQEATSIADAVRASADTYRDVENENETHFNGIRPN